MCTVYHITKKIASGDGPFWQFFAKYLRPCWQFFAKGDTPFYIFINILAKKLQNYNKYYIFITFLLQKC